jgi:hypothetical protein
MFRILVNLVHIHLVIKTVKFFDIDVRSLSLVCLVASRFLLQIRVFDYEEARQWEKFVIISQQSRTIRNFETRLIKMQLHFNCQIAKIHCTFISIRINLQISRDKILLFIQKDSRVIFWLLSKFENTMKHAAQEKTISASW